MALDGPRGWLGIRSSSGWWVTWLLARLQAGLWTMNCEVLGRCHWVSCFPPSDQQSSVPRSVPPQHSWATFSTPHPRKAFAQFLLILNPNCHVGGCHVCFLWKETPTAKFLWETHSGKGLSPIAISETSTLSPNPQIPDRVCGFREHISPKNLPGAAGAENHHCHPRYVRGIGALPGAVSRQSLAGTCVDSPQKGPVTSGDKEVPAGI